MKKIFCLLFCLCTALSLSVNTLAAEETKFNKYEVVSALGFMENDGNGEFNPDNKVTRSEFAEIACKVMGVDISDGLLDFRDVSAEDERYNYIFSICAAELMVGRSLDEFAPYEFITYNEVIKVMMIMMGYEKEAQYYGGYPSGYISVAQSIGIPSGGGYVTKGQLANIVYECMRTPTREWSFENNIKTEDGKTLLAKYHNIIFGEGVVGANCHTSIDSTKSTGNNSIEINGSDIECTMEHMNLLGYNVEFYVTEQDGVYKLVCAIPKNNTVLNVKWDEFIPENSSIQRIAYESDTGGDKYIKLSDTVNLIYNGVYLFDCTVDDFIPTYGETVFLDNDSDGVYDIAIADDYKAMRVGRVMPNDGIIYSAEGNDSVSLKDLGAEDIIFENNGEMVWLNSIEELYDSLQTDSILLIAESKSGDKTVKLRASDSQITRKINSKSDEYVVSENIVYEFNPYILERLPQLMVGKQYVLYLDSYGLVSDCIIDNSEAKKYGYLIDAKAFDEEGEMIMKIKVYTMQSTFETILSGEKVTVKVGDNKRKYTASEACDFLYKDGKVKNQLIVFDVDEAGLLKSFEVASEEFGKKGKEYFSLNYDNANTYIPFGYYIVGASNGSLPYEYSGIYNVGNVLRITVPSSENLDNEKMYKIDTISNTEQAGLDPVHMMVYDADSVGRPSIVVVVGKGFSSDFKKARVMVVDNAVESIDENDEPITILTGYCMQQYAEYMIPDEELGQKALNLSRGDVVFVYLNSVGEIEDFEYSFSYAEKKMYKIYDFLYNSSTTKHAINVHDTTGGTLTMIQRYCMYGVITDIQVIHDNKYAVEISMNGLDSEALDGKTSWNFRRILEVGTADGNVVIHDGRLKSGGAKDLRVGDSIYFSAWRNYSGDLFACVAYR